VKKVGAQGVLMMRSPNMQCVPNARDGISTPKGHF